MTTRKIIVYSADPLAPLNELWRRADSLWNHSSFIFQQTIDGLAGALYRHAAANPLVVLTIANTGELGALLLLASLLERFDLVLLLPSGSPDIKNKCDRFRPRLVLGDDDDPQKTDLLLRGILTKQKRTAPAADSQGEVKRGVS